MREQTNGAVAIYIHQRYSDDDVHLVDGWSIRTYIQILESWGPIERRARRTNERRVEIYYPLRPVNTAFEARTP